MAINSFYLSVKTFFVYLSCTFKSLISLLPINEIIIYYSIKYKKINVSIDFYGAEFFRILHRSNYGGIMSHYQLEIKQLVDYPRCRIYRRLVQSLISDRNIRTGGGSGLFYYTVLSCYANFRTSYRRFGGINYTILPGEWLCKLKEITAWFRLRFDWKTIAALKDLQERHLITFNILGNGRLVRFKIVEWHKYNRVLEYNAPCQKDVGFFFLPVHIASDIIGTRRPSEMDIILDLWLNTVYNDDQVDGSKIAPVVYMKNGSGTPLVSYAELARRYNISKATVGRYLKKFERLDIIAVSSFPGTHGTVISLKNYLPTMFQIPDVVLDKEEIAMALNITVNLHDDIANEKPTVSEANTRAIVQRVKKILISQGFLCCECSLFRYKLLELSDCQGTKIPYPLMYKRPTKYRLIMCCKNKEITKFDLTLYPIKRKENQNEN